MFGMLAAVMSERVSDGWAHGGAGLVIGSTADGGGALRVDFDFTNVVPVSFSASLGGTSIYTAGTPSFNALTTDKATAFVLDDETALSLEITALDPGATGVKVNGTVLDAVGESAVLGTFDADAGAFHAHPEWQLLLALPAGAHGERTIGFRLTTTASGYAASDSYTLRLSNGHLPPLDLDEVAYDASAVTCQKTIAAATRAFAAAKHQRLGRCLDKLGVAAARHAAGLDDAKAKSAAASLCGAGLLAKIAAARDKAAAQIDKKCGAAAAAELTTLEARAHLGYVACEVDRLIAASYAGTKIALEHLTVEGEDLASYFPCLAGATVKEQVHE